MNPLELEIRDKIEQEGPITFHDFMELALYHPTHGYYNRHDMEIGQGGDFYTAANVHRLYGETLAVRMLRLWRSIETSGPVTFLEVGAGTGQTAKDILRGLQADGLSAQDMRYLIIEQSPSLRGRQQEALSDMSGIVEWVDTDDVPDLEAVVLQSELVDALPTHRVTYDEGKLQEVYVDVEDGIFVDRPGTLSDSRLDEYWRRYCSGLSEGSKAEINLNAMEWTRSLAGLLRKGFVVTVDYGMKAAELYSDARTQGTLICYRNHQLVSDPYEAVGRQDITSHVNFSALEDAGRTAGLDTVSCQTQANFLIDSGLIERLALHEQTAGSEVEKVKARMAVKRLVFPQGMGDVFRVLIQQKV